MCKSLFYDYYIILLLLLLFLNVYIVERIPTTALPGT